MNANVNAQTSQTQTMDGQDLDRLWVLYKETGDEEAKNELLISYMGLVERIVRRMMPKYGGYNEYDDLVSCGVLGLIDAAEKFDLSMGLKFETYAVTRIRGEILDYMRSQDWASSSLRKKISAITDAYDRLEAKNGLPPSEEQVARELGTSVNQVHKILAKNHVFNVVSFEEALTQVCDRVGDGVDSPEGALVSGELREVLAELIEALPEKERLVISLYYYEELMLKEIASILEVTESRVSQIHSKVLGKLRSQLERLALV